MNLLAIGKSASIGDWTKSLIVWQFFHTWRREAPDLAHYLSLVKEKVGLEGCSVQG